MVLAFFFLFLKYTVTVVLMCVPMFVFYMHSPAWLHSVSAVPLCSWMSTCLSVLDHSGPVCQLVDICLLPPPSVVMAATTHTHTITTMPLLLPGWPFPPLSRVSPPPDTSCEPLMLILQSTSCGPVISLASTALSLKLSLCSAAWTGSLTQKHLI